MATVEEALQQAALTLKDAGYVHGQREAELFFANILQIDSSSLFTRYEDEVDSSAEEQLDEAVKKRLEGQPVAYVIGTQSFMGWTMQSDERALIPRPETEQLCEHLIREIRSHHLEAGDFLEIGTGAGPIAIALKKYYPHATVTATDISEEALDLAADNAKRLKTEINFLQSDLFTNVEGQYDVIVANLPYVPTERLSFVADQILDWEPMIAIEAGSDGLLYIIPFLKEVKKHLKKGGIIAIEFWHTHGEAVKELVAQELPGYEVKVIRDLADFDRFAFILPKDS